MGGGRKTRSRVGATLVIAGALLLAIAPWLASRAGFRDRVLKSALPLLNGRLQTGDGSWGWFTPVKLENAEVFAVDGTRAMQLPSVQGDQPLWRLATHPRSLGTFRAEHARLEVIVGPAGVNLANLITPQRHELSVGFDIVDGMLSFRSVDSPRDWQVGPINLQAELQSAAVTPSGQMELVLRPGTVCRHALITADMCRDLLQYLLPVVSGTTDVSGDLSLELDQWRLPTTTPQQGAGSGRVLLHRIDVGTGGISQRLTTLLHLPAQLTVARESIVEFRMFEGRIYHRNLTLGQGKVRVRTHGSVGLDESLDMVAEVALVDENAAVGPLGTLLQGVPIPIAGTLRNPQIDKQFLKDFGHDLMQGLFSDFWEKHRPKRKADAPSTDPQPTSDEAEKKSLWDKLFHKPPR